MTRADLSAVLPRPTSLFVGRFAEPWGLIRTGRLRDAVTLLSEIGAGTLAPGERAYLLHLLIQCRLGMGELGPAVAAGEDLAPFQTATGPSVTLAHLAAGELASALGDHARSLHHFRTAGATTYADDPDLTSWRAGAVLALVRTGSRTEAVSLAHEMLRLAEDASEPYPLAVALRTAAIADSGIDPVPALRRARGLAEHSNDLRLAAQIDADLAGHALLRPSPDLASTLALLRGAEALANAEGLWPLHARVSRLLARAGERAASVPLPVSSTLTGAERRVAAMAADGLSNRQIAEQLSVTIKGVEWHLSRVYRKLGITSRAQLAPHLVDLVPRPRSAPV